MDFEYPLKDDSRKEADMPHVSEGPYKECVYLPVPSEAIKGLEAGGDVRVVLVGKVKGFSSHEYGSSIDIELDKAKVEYGETEFEQMAKEDA